MPVGKTVNRRQLAIEDVAGHSGRIAESSLGAALRFLDSIESTVQLLREFPEAGGRVPTQNPDANGLRAKLVSDFGNYVILYFVTNEAIDIVRVIRAGQDIDHILLRDE